MKYKKELIAGLFIITLFSTSASVFAANTQSNNIKVPGTIQQEHKPDQKNKEQKEKEDKETKKQEKKEESKENKQAKHKRNKKHYKKEKGSVSTTTPKIN